ncbi:MAG TPA: FtsX-like permease family protein, partial [Actinomycetes bacterium]|nr:FtsX-like permease family protein [Actinomycetes bacterium]
FAAVDHDTFTLTPAERAERLMGAAQAAVAWPQDGPVLQDPARLESFLVAARPPAAAPAAPPSLRRLLALLPPGSRAIPDQAGGLRVRTAAGVGDLDARALDYADPLARGILRPLAGRAPASANEVALTPAAARRAGAGLGGTLRTVEAAGGRAFRVVGLVEDPTDLEAATVLLRPGALPPDRGDLRWLVAAPGPLTWPQVKALNTHGLVAVSRYVLAHPPATAERYPELAGGSRFARGVPGLVAGLALLEVVLLAGPAFAVGARRRRRDLALVAAAGGTPAQLRRIVLADGVVLGTAAALAGLLLGVAAAAAGRPLLEQHLAHARSGGFRVFPAALAGLAALAVATGVLAALVPAWIAARQDVVAALAGRRGITRSRRRWVALGAALVAAGALLSAGGARRVSPTAILVGLAVAELGLVLCTPAAVGLVARLGGRLPLAARVALRDTARNRTAAAPAISAVMAAVVGSLAVGVMLTASSQRAMDDYRSLTRPGQVVLDASGKLGRGRPVPPRAVATLRRTLPVARVYQLGLPSCGGDQCFVTARVPAGASCPYAPEVLRHDPTAAEQRAARRDHRCDGVGGLYRYFRNLETDSFTLIVDGDAVGPLTGLAGGDAERAAAALRAGKVVVDHPRYVHDGKVTLAISSFHEGAKARDRTRTVAAAGFAPPQRPRAPLVMMTAATARTLGVGTVPTLALATTSRMPTLAEQDRLQATLGSQVGVYVERGPRARSDTRSLLLLAVVAGLITLGAAAIATGLAAADGRADLATLAAVGASPRVRRGLSLCQSGVIAGLGSLLGAAAGLGGSVAVLAALNRGYGDLWPAPTPYPVAVPWLNVGASLLLVPAVAMLGAGLLTRSRLPVERR